MALTAAQCDEVGVDGCDSARERRARKSTSPAPRRPNGRSGTTAATGAAIGKAAGARALLRFTEASSRPAFAFASASITASAAAILPPLIGIAMGGLRCCG
eukprot:CAMPEP_0115833204 /NCGR_PEP_ID=MMETSP0287-20121206/3051_1 /TAXON_ID=412157 /ORGANISM="Chrysochromulina rotalis, Strain UIO044" /LENGTH=100 /DNA_ID=CAMNT_0003286609 /DNA_START=322 /DNA_END=620 /DNA_ORIENTATION=+